MRRVLFAIWALVVGCSNGGGEPVVAEATVSGSAFKATVSGGTVDVYRLGANGVREVLLGTDTTDASGNYSVNVGAYRGWALVSISGGTFTDEATQAQETIPAEFPLYSVARVDGPTVGGVVVTPLTTLSYFHSLQYARDVNTDMDVASLDSDIAIGEFFGGVDIRILPIDVTDPGATPGAAADAGLAVAGLSQLAADAGVPPTELVHARGRDSFDFVFDGLEFATAIPLSSQNPLPTGDFSQLLADAMRVVLGNSPLTEQDTTVVQALEDRNSSTIMGAPRIIAADNAGAAVGQARTVTLRLGGPCIQLGNPMIVIETRFLEVASTSTREIGVNWLSFDTPTDLAAGTYDVRLIDDLYGFEWLSPDLLRIVDTTAVEPQFTVSPRIVSVAGGERLRIDWPSTLDNTRAFFGNTEVPVVKFSVGRWLETDVPPGTDTSIRLENGGLSATRTNVLTRTDLDLGLGGPLDLSKDVCLVGSNFDFSGGQPSGRYHKTMITPTDLDTGTFTRTDHRFTAGQTPQTETITGTTFIDTNGQEVTFLSQGTSEQFFTKAFFGKSAFGVALSNFGQDIVFNKDEQPSQPDDMEGEWQFSASFYRFEDELSVGTLMGSFHFDDQGEGSFNAMVDYKDIPPLGGVGFAGPKVLFGAAKYTPGLPGEGTIDLTGLDDLDFLQVEVLRGPQGTIFGAVNQFGYIQGLFKPAESGIDTRSEDGTAVSAGIRLRYDLEWKLSATVNRTVVGTGAAGRVQKTFREGTTDISASFSGGTNLEDARVSSGGFLGVDGTIYSANGTPRGLVDTNGGIAYKGGPLPTLDGQGTDTGSRVGTSFRVGTVQLIVQPQITNRDFIRIEIVPVVENFQRFQTEFIADVGSFDTILGSTNYDIPGGIVQRTERDRTSKIPFFGKIPLVGRLFTSVQAGERNRDQLMVFITPEIVNPNSQLNHHLPGHKPFTETPSNTPLEMAMRGNATPDGEVLLTRDSGNGPGSSITLWMDNSNTQPSLAASYHVGGHFFDFDANDPNGRLTATSIRGILTLDTPSAGMFSVSAQVREEGEDGVVTNNNDNVTGTYAVGGDGSLTFTIPNGGGEPDTVLRGRSTGDGEMIFAVDMSDARRAGFLFMVARASTAPPIGSYFGLNFHYDFTNTGVVPAETEQSVGSRSLTQNVGQVNITGLDRKRTDTSTEVVPQQILLASTSSVSADGTLDANINSELHRGAVSRNGRYAFAMPGTTSITRTAINVFYRR